MKSKRIQNVASGIFSIFSFASKTPKSYQQLTGYATDAEALTSDWKKVGMDLENAMKEESQRKSER